MRRLLKPSPPIPASSASLPLFQNSSIKVRITYTRTYFIDLCTTVHFYLVSPSMVTLMVLYHASEGWHAHYKASHVSKTVPCEGWLIPIKEAWHWPTCSLQGHSDHLSAAWPLHAIVHSEVQDKHRTPARSGSSMRTD